MVLKYKQTCNSTEKHLAFNVKNHNIFLGMQTLKFLQVECVHTRTSIEQEMPEPNRKSDET